MHDGAFDGGPCDLLHVFKAANAQKRRHQNAPVPWSLLRVRRCQKGACRGQGPSAMAPEPTAMDLRFDFEVRYCGRTSIARGVSGSVPQTKSLIDTHAGARRAVAGGPRQSRTRGKLCAVSSPIDKACRSRQPEAPSMAGRVIARRPSIIASGHRRVIEGLQPHAPGGGAAARPG